MSKGRNKCVECEADAVDKRMVCATHAPLYDDAQMDRDVVAYIASRLGKTQRRGLLALSGDFGPSGEFVAMRRLWYRKDIPQILDHQHAERDCWALRPIGIAVRGFILRTGGRRTE